MTTRSLAAAILGTLLMVVLVAVPAPAAADSPRSCAVKGFASSTSPQSGQDAQRRPVVLVHGWTGAPMNDTADKLKQQLGSKISTYVFDYSHWASYWAADDHIAPCLADYLNQISAAYTKTGGDGKIIVVAHSMGGLATRYAMDGHSVDNPVPAATIPYIITLGTPSLGSPWGGTAYARAKEILQKIFGHADPPGASGGDCLATHTKGQALPGGCGSLPPWLPAGVKFTQIAGDATVDRTLFGHTLYTIPLFSDGIVPVPSAHGYPTSGPSGIPPISGAITASRTYSCHVDFGLVARSAADLGFFGAQLGLDYITLQDLQNDTFGPTVQAYLGGTTLTAPCSHIHLPTDQSALNQTTETIKGALDALTQPPPTKIVTITGIDKAGNPAPGFTVNASGNPVESCEASPASKSPAMASCAPTAAGADVCWIKPDRTTLLCGTNPWEKRLLQATSTEPIGQLTPKPNPDPWGLVLADGARCRLRNGGSWGGRADNYVGAYSCDRGETEYILVDPNTPQTAVNTSSPTWTVHIGPLGDPGQTFPPPKTINVTTAYFPGTP